MTKPEMGRHHIVWLRDVAGLDRYTNSVCYATDPDRDQHRMMALFPGDIMDEGAVMPAQYRQFSFENAAMSILKHDPYVGSVVVIASAERHGDTACFTHFIGVAPEGNAAPYRSDGHATVHLHKLLENISEKLNMNGIPRIVLAGFSRGGVVVNQIITELGRSKHDELWSKVDEVRWIDTGNSPGFGAFPLDETASRMFAEMAGSQPIKILIAGSPFQWKNPCKVSWLISLELNLIAVRLSTLTERQNFVEILRPYLSHPNLAVRYHFADRASNLEDHFAMLVDHLHPENGIDISGA